MNLPLQPQPGRQRGFTAVEFALTCVFMFTLVFGVMEMARLSFLWNSLMQATSAAARGAATTPFDQNKLDIVRANAIFASTATETMTMTDNINAQNLLIDYLDANRKHVTAVPTCQIENLTNCAADPNSNSCVRFVRVRLCQPGSDGTSCTNVPYHTMIPLPTMNGLNINLPWFTAIVPLEAQAIPGNCT